MKNRILRYLLPLMCICMMLTSCGHKLKSCSGIVTYIQKDTLKMKVGKDEATFLTVGGKYDNGIVVVEDSAEVTYIGTLSKGRAMLIRLIPKKGRIIDIKKDTTKVLVTSPAPPAQVKKFKKFIKEEKERLHQN